jgi:hypothetical protein
MTSELDKAGIKAAARAIAVARGVIPDALYCIVTSSAVDHMGSDGRRYIYAWRKYTREAEAAVRAYLAAAPAAPEPDDPLYRAMLDDGIITTAPEPVAEAIQKDLEEIRYYATDNWRDHSGYLRFQKAMTSIEARITALQAEVERLARQYSEIINDFSATAHELETLRAELADWRHGHAKSVAAHAVSLDRATTAEADLATARRHIEVLQAKVSDGSCGCAVDAPDAICDHHSPQLATARQQIERLLVALGRATEVLENYADPSGYYDGDGDPYEADGQHPGLLAKDAAASARATLKETENG